jgi:dTDP-4-amino-4,6-dideoxygalactose transaminase
VFCDVDPATLNIDPAEVERRVTDRTRMIMPVHYAGVPSDMEALGRIAAERGLWLVEDAAQGVGSTWRGRALGTIGHMGCVSFHVTKNLVCGEGGALLTDDDELARKSEIIREKGTNRAAFLRGEVDKYTWVGPGGSYVLSDLLAALLEVQLRRFDAITAERVAIWERYHAGLEDLERDGLLRRPAVAPDVRHNGHIYWVCAATPELQERVLDALRAEGVKATFHFQPLHASPYARERLGPPEELPVSVRAAETIIRLPLWSGLADDQVDRVIDSTRRAFRA